MTLTEMRRRCSISFYSTSVGLRGLSPVVLSTHESVSLKYTEHVLKSLRITLEGNPGIDERLDRCDVTAWECYYERERMLLNSQGHNTFSRDSWLEEAQVWLACNAEQVGKDSLVFLYAVELSPLSIDCRRPK